MVSFFAETSINAVPICLLSPALLPEWLRQQDSSTHEWINALHFKATPLTLALVPDQNGKLQKALWGEGETFWHYADLAVKLPAGTYFIDKELDSQSANHACLAWGLSFYTFDKYKKKESPSTAVTKQLVWPENADRQWVVAHLKAINQVRDWINLPAADCTPQTLADSACQIAETYQAHINIVTGPQLQRDYPCVYTVGKAAAAEPCYIHLYYRPDQAVKKLALVGKGVCFDSGGLDIKSSSNMVLMKKDMGGAAHALALAELLMAMKLPVELDVYIPAVENGISGQAMHPLDVIYTRKGLTVEIGNTDAEGRLILADALTEASSHHPDLILDFATLTGAARVALGTDLPALFCNQSNLIPLFLSASSKTLDPVWPLPLHKPYLKQLKSSVADLSSTGKTSYGGAILAALFLEHFIEPSIPWIHIDLMAYNLTSTPGRPEGGEAMALRAAYEFLVQWIGNDSPLLA